MGQLNHHAPDVPFENVDMKKCYTYVGTSSRIEYEGTAKAGTAKSAVGWQIKKNTYDVNDRKTDTMFADGSNDYVGIWDDRASYTYS